MGDNGSSARAIEPRNISYQTTPSASSSNSSRQSHEPNLQIRHHHHAPHLGSPPSAGRLEDAEQLTSPVTPSKRSERIFPISSVVNPPYTLGAGNTEPLKSNSSGRWTASTPTPYFEHGNPFDGDRLYVNFNEELDRQRQNKESIAARYASSHDISGAQNIGLLQHPMTMRFHHKETDEGHCVVTVWRLPSLV